MKRILSLIITTLLVSTTAFANSTDSTSRVKFKFGGRIDLLGFYDSYQGVDTRGGAMYFFPSHPDYNADGWDMNRVGRLRMSMATTRLNAGVTIPNLLGATGRGYVEIDFLGAGDAVINMPRMRHAYFSLDWKRQRLLIGQTSHLVLVEETAANTVTFGSGWPFNPLSRPVQIQFTQRFGKYGKFDAAIAMFGGACGVGQSYALAPDLHARFTFGNPKHLSGGIVGGVAAIKPRTLTADSSRATQFMISWDVAAFLKYNFSGHSLSLFAMTGTDLSRYDMTGGYGPLVSQIHTQDYGYSGIGTVSAWLDYQTKAWKGWQVGIFAGLQQNLGSTEKIVASKAQTPNAGIDKFWRVAPRITYSYGSHLIFGLEYMYAQATWGKEFDSNYRPLTYYNDTENNRVTLLARFKF